MRSASNSEIWCEYFGDSSVAEFVAEIDAHRDIEVAIDEYLDSAPNMFGVDADSEERDLVRAALLEYVDDGLERLDPCVKM